jgi:membrane-associated phospholipid phosphatase
LLTLISLAGWFICTSKPKWTHLRRYFLVIVLTAVIGPGLVVNGVVKNYWGRPRPRQVQEFGGQWEYRDVFQPGVPGKGKSFPCGHCTMGYLLCTLLVFRREKPWVAYLGSAVGLGFGSMVGIARMVQGAHFPNDALGSLYVILMVSTGLYYLVLQVPKPQRLPQRRSLGVRRRWMAAALVAVAGLITTAFLLHRPFYEEYRVPLQIDRGLTDIVIHTNADVERFHVQFTDMRPATIDVEAHGFAWVNAGHELDFRTWQEKGQLHIEFMIEKRGYFAELVHDIDVLLPRALEHSVKVELATPDT